MARRVLDLAVTAIAAAAIAADAAWLAAATATERVTGRRNARARRVARSHRRGL